jgi:hypothetical protein
MKLNTEKRCKKCLYNIRSKVSCKCGCSETYFGKDYVLICKECKSKISPYSGTIFHDVRFGIVKAFEIVLYYHSENYSVSSIKIAKKYGITQKTAYNFLMKIVNNKPFIKMIVNYKDSITNIDEFKSEKVNKEVEDKLINFLNKIKFNKS